MRFVEMATVVGVLTMLSGIASGAEKFEARGVVRDAHFHKPIAGATVFDLCSSCPSIAHTDSNGQFVIALKDALQRTVQIDAPGYGSRTSPIHAGDSIQVELPLGILISGRVVTETGGGVANADVTCELEAYVGGARVTGKTDATGHFMLDGCPSAIGAVDGMQLSVAHPRYSAVQDLGPRSAGEQVRDLEVKVADAFTVHGRITSSDRRAVGQALVIAFDHTPQGMRRHAVRVINANDDGRFEMPLPKGTFTLSAVAPSGLAGVREITVAGSTPADLELPVPQTITGHVRVGNTPLEDAFVSLRLTQETQAGVAQMYLTTSTAKLWAYTDAEGNFRIPSMTPGHYWLEVSHPRTGKLNRTISSSEPIDIEYPESQSIAVQVVTADGAPANSGWAYAEPHVPPKTVPPGTVWPKARLRAGSAIISGLTAGTWDVYAVLDHTTAGMTPRQVETVNGKPTPPVEITMPKMWTLRGRFVSKTGEPVPSAKVISFAKIGNASHNTQIGLITDAEGKFAVPGAAGEIQLQFEDPAVGACTTTVKVGEGDIDVGTFTVMPLPPGLPPELALPHPGMPFYGFRGICQAVKAK